MELIVLLTLYFIPALIAGFRYHCNGGMIFLTNLIFGWTGIGWFIAFIWAFSHQNKRCNA